VSVKLFLGGVEVKVPEGAVKIVVEGLGVNADRQLHHTFSGEGVVQDVVEYDGQISGTAWETYEELADMLCAEDI
jgi:hypothetical protein